MEIDGSDGDGDAGVSDGGDHAEVDLARGPVAGPLMASFRSPAVHQDRRRDLGLNALLDLNVKN